MAVTSARRDGACVLLSVSALGAIVSAALLPPAEPASQAGMRLLIHITGHPLTYKLRSGAESPRVPASAAHASPQSEGGGTDVSGHGGIEAGSKTPKAQAELAQSASAGSAGLCQGTARCCGCVGCQQPCGTRRPPVTARRDSVDFATRSTSRTALCISTMKYQNSRRVWIKSQLSAS